MGKRREKNDERSMGIMQAKSEREPPGTFDLRPPSSASRQVCSHAPRRKESTWKKERITGEGIEGT